MYKGRHYKRAFLKERTRELVGRYLLMHENPSDSIPGNADSQQEPFRRNYQIRNTAESVAGYNMLLTYLNYLVNVKTDKERSSWWSQAQVQAEKLHFTDYRMSILTKQRTTMEAAP